MPCRMPLVHFHRLVVRPRLWSHVHPRVSPSTIAATTSAAAAAFSSSPPSPSAAAPVSLRSYQEELLKQTRAAYDAGVYRQLWVAATGLGKTVCFAHLPHVFPELADRRAGGGMLVLVHRQELLQQAVERVRACNPGLQIAVENQYFECEPDATASFDVVCGTVQSLGRRESARLDRYHRRFGIVVVDEAHHLMAEGSYERVLDFVGVGPSTHSLAPVNALPERQGLSPRKLLIGVTATPARSDGLGLGRFFDRITANYDLRHGVAEGFLVDIRPKCVRTEIVLDPSAERLLPPSAGSLFTVAAGGERDFSPSFLREFVDVTVRNELIVRTTAEEIARTGASSVLVFASSVPHAYSLASLFRSPPFRLSAAALDATTPIEERIRIIHSFRNERSLQVLCNYGILTEGFDAPHVDMIVMARPTLSRTLYLQMLGRGTRPILPGAGPPGSPPQDVFASRDATAEQRRQAIACSAKPALRVLDFVDVTRRLSPVSAASLIGLGPVFDAQGEVSLFTELAPIVDSLPSDVLALSRCEPASAARQTIDDLQALKVSLENISFWGPSVAPSNDGDGDRDAPLLDSLGATLRWMRFRWTDDGTVTSWHLIVGSLPLFLDLSRDLLGQWSVHLWSLECWQHSLRTEASSELVVASTWSLSAAMSTAEKFVADKYPAEMGLCDRRAGWLRRPCSDKQRAMLVRCKLLDPGSDKRLTMGEASMLISRHKHSAKFSKMRRIALERLVDRSASPAGAPLADVTVGSGVTDVDKTDGDGTRSSPRQLAFLKKHGYILPSTRPEDLSAAEAQSLVSAAHMARKRRRFTAAAWGRKRVKGQPSDRPSAAPPSPSLPSADQ